MGSEPGMGWHWIVSLAQYCDCYVISEGEFRPKVEQWMTQSENKLFILVVLLVFHLLISGKLCKEMQLENISHKVLTLLIFHSDISGKETKDLQL